LRVPRLDSNSDYVTITQWLVRSGDFVTQGEPIAVIETSKVTTELIAEGDGYIYMLVPEGTDVRVGQVVGFVSDTDENAANGIVSGQEREEGTELKMSRKAKELMVKYGIDRSLLPRDRIVRESDILRLVGQPYSISDTRSQDLLIYGGGGICKLIIDIVRKRGEYSICGIIDRRFPELKEVSGVPVIAGNGKNELREVMRQGYVRIINSVAFDGRMHGRKEPYVLLKELGFTFVNVIHDKAVVEPSIRMGEGNVIAAGAIVGSETWIGNNCIINAGAIVSHDCIISDHCHIASGAVLGGNVVVNENTLIGQGCTIFKNVRIGRNVVIKNGANVFSNVPDNEIVG